MSLSGIVDMANSASLINRVAAQAAVIGITNPQGWASANAWKVAASAGWADKWAYATANLTANYNPDLGARYDVISDADIVAAVTAVQATTGTVLPK